MNTLKAIQNALQASQTAREGGDMELALIEAHNLIEAAEAYALELSREFMRRQMHGTIVSVVLSNNVRKRS